MNKLAVALLLCACACAAAWFWWYPTAPGIPTPDGDPVTTGGGAVPRHSDGAAGAQTDPTRRGDTEPEHRTTSAVRCAVRGRLLDERGGPLVGCRVEARARPRRVAPMPAAELVELAAVVESAADGRFALELPVQPGDDVVLTTRRDGCADLHGAFPWRGSAIETGDVRVPAGVRLIGRVVDERGTVQPGVDLRFYRQLVGRAGPLAPKSFVRATSDANGVLPLDGHLACDTWTVHVAGSAKLLAPSPALVLQPDAVAQQVDFVVRPADPSELILGRVVDDRERGVAGAVVEADDATAWPSGTAISAADGSFELRCRRPPGKPVHLQVKRVAGFELLHTPETYAWGTRGVVLALRRAGNVRLEVVDAENRRPVEAFRVVWFQRHGNALGAQHRGEPEVHAGGRTEVLGVPQGETTMVVIPTDPELAPNEPITFVKTESTPLLEVRLPRRVELVVRVVRGDGQPVGGTALELVQPGAAKVTPATRVLDPSRVAMHAQQGGHSALLLDRVTTDARGVATLRWPAGDKPLALRVLGPGHVPLVRAPVYLRRGAPRLEIEVDTGATVQGRVGPLPVLARLGLQAGGSALLAPALVWTREAVGEARISRRVRLDPNGSYRVVGLPAGTWRIRFESSRAVGVRTPTAAHKDLGTLTLAAQDAVQMDYDVRDLEPASLRGTVMLDGVPARSAAVYLVRIAEPGAPAPLGVRSTLVRTDRDGGFTAELAPGRYSLGLDAPTSRGGARVRLTCAQSIDVAPGQQASGVFAVDIGRLRVRVRDRDGRAAANQVFRVSQPGSGFAASVRSNSDGLLLLDPIAVGQYTVAVLRPTTGGAGAARWGGAGQGTYVAIGTVEVTAGGGVVELTLQR
ncbi:MAG: hypothetical protein KDC87_07235 [Planctomycetes bacterium]|nr:hypothetical protein [Planctomycetota bacterium]MCB9870658.1 hypothetical protein [Planctomycetota bacterium]